MMDRIESQTSGDIQKVEEKRYIYIHQFPYPGDDMGHLPAVQLTATSYCAETGTVPLVRTPACCWTDPYHRKQREIPISLYIYIYICGCRTVVAAILYWQYLLTEALTGLERRMRPRRFGELNCFSNHWVCGKK